MATKRTTTTTRKGFSWTGFVNLLAYLAIVFIGLALLLAYLPFTKELASALTLIAQLVAYALVGYFSFNYAIHKRHWAYITIWIVAVVLVVVFTFL